MIPRNSRKRKHIKLMEEEAKNIGSPDLVGNDEQKVDVKTIDEIIAEERRIKITNPYADPSLFLSSNPLGTKKRGTNRTPPKKKRKKR